MKIPFLKVPKKSESKIIGLIIGIVVSASVAFLYNDVSKRAPVVSFFYDLMNNLEYRTFDMRFNIRGPLPQKDVSKRIVLLDYDNESEKWNPFPPDRMYYIDIVRALGAKGVGANAVFFDIFFFDKSGRKLDPDSLEIFTEKFNALQEAVARNADETNGISMRLKTKLSEAAELLKAGNTAGTLSIIDELTSDTEIIDNINKMKDVGELFARNQDLQDIAPDRDLAFRNEIKDAGNLYLGQIVEDLETPPYKIADILFNPKVHKTFADMVAKANRTVTRNQMELDINSTINNMTPAAFKELLAADKAGKYKGRKTIPFSEKQRKAIEGEKAKVDMLIGMTLELNKRFGYAVAKDAPETLEQLERRYRRLRLIKPLYKELAEPAAGLGYVKPELYKDGIIRMAAPMAEFEGLLYPHIAPMLAIHYLGVDKKHIEFHTNRIIFKGAKIPGENKSRDISIPLYKGTSLLVNWAGPFTQPNQFDHRSFKQTYEASVNYNIIKRKEAGEELTPKQEKIFASLTPAGIKSIKDEIGFFKDKIVIIGLTADGTHDLNPIPFSPRYPLVGMHANLINTIFNNLFIKTLPFSGIAIILLIAGAAMGYVGSTEKQLTGALAAIGIIIGYGAICALVFIFARMWLPFVPIVAAVVFTYLVVLGYRFMTEGQEAKKMKSMFSTYVNPSVVDTLIANPEKLRLGGERMELTAMFALAWGPGLKTTSAEILVERLNEYFTAMTEQIFKYDGTLDKYEGQIIMAIFGAPVHFDDHAAKACLACAGMRQALADLTEKWNQENKEHIYTTVGLNSGPMIAGNMGSASRFNYTIMGDAVNLSARILGAARMYGVDYCISEVTYNQAKEKVICRLIDNVIVVGKVEPAKIYQVLAGTDAPMPEPMRKLKEYYEKGYELYCQRQWDKAIASFNAALEVWPGDEPSKLLIKRCEQYKAAPPPETWQGEFALTSKGL